MREVRWERMFRDELERAFAECPLVYFPYGLCEPHGPQNALGLDGLKVHAIACLAAREHGGIVAPLDMWHIHDLGLYSSWGHAVIGPVERSWMTAMPPWQHFRNVMYHIRQADALGFHGAVLLTGHYGPNWEDLNDLVALLQPSVGTRLCALPDFEANTPGFDNDGRSGGDHAGKVETSLMWALDPTCVDVSRIPPADAPGHHFAMGRNALESDRRVGERMVADEVRYLGAKARELLHQYAALKPEHRMTTFADVERAWSAVVKPAMRSFRTVGGASNTADAPPEGSPWLANWPVPEEW